MARDVVITGIGLASSLGEGIEAHAQALASNAAPVVDTQSFAPYPLHPLKPLELDKQIPKKSDQRQMEPWQRLGVYAAGLALDDAGLKDDTEAKSQLQVIVAAGGGERDHAVDAAVLAGLRNANQPGAFLNERLMGDLRPTLFLAQLSNLLAGNIGIVHGITGASRTLMGEEQAGVDAIRTAQARIAAGQADIILVGGAYNAERRDMLLLFELGGFLRSTDFAPVFARSEAPGMITGSAGAFLVLESAERAAARGARAHARLSHAGAHRSRRQPGSVAKALDELLSGFGPIGANVLAISAATGCAEITDEEAAAIAKAAPKARRIATGDLVGHSIEAAFPVSVALAASALSTGAANEAIVTGAAHWRGEGAARLVKA
ncbi:3-oxoacyl-(acyl-carrier-protein) synthase II [Bosea sp. 62]|uniref:beta-ketoacyl-ACP synthase n=1 Tax=unclassified Bosea (in: a-proteobacteria) TaxID=2653178 RepID=UPI001253B2E6|nr:MULTISPECIES: beta-ketoacyl-ACP synthase [unclassified Bosea (in: a-proteobacteria)]CAD5249655.1 3-oxoacyl-(acyl-carrier-protein) synthase II [Bosea sp. 7B]CAD5282860.1 3-oxoacyl-(acyl-carrier-protein) synthase II [Bosea sp. 21B]CAD5285521.1 3-oxoacyl-(acyl-carrier-protein) synthase II [Bosea sp. 46]VVT62295.1 3-oxoacyl-(acyl-carrier-protein) synthase II [Bosea sp. EC-HK365B]VXB20040.1 3-oxoacyl-(acyl-carrier-protein) synthase II [Bosea sp. 62]